MPHKRKTTVSTQGVRDALTREGQAIARLFADPTQPRLLTDEMVDALNNPASSYWMKTAIMRIVDRDPVDAMNEVEALHRLLLKWYRPFRALSGEPTNKDRASWAVREHGGA